jgi:DeoR family transcriptional regulator, aga operon transcriptional repressor
MELDTNLSNIERQRRIIAEIETRKRINVAQICELFQVSEATARRDLEQLAEQQKVQRVHGGAIILHPDTSHGQPPEPPILTRSRDQRSEKQRIGMAAADLICEGETVFIGSGTTAQEIAWHLKGRRQITVITNSLPVLNLLSSENGIHLIALGGELRLSEQSFIGHITEQSLQELRADKVFSGIRAIHLEHGLTNDYLPETRTDRAILDIGREVILVADHSKMDRVSTVFLSSLEKINTLITDEKAPREFVEALRQRGVQVILA